MNFNFLHSFPILCLFITYVIAQDTNKTEQSPPLSSYIMSQQCATAFFEMNDWLNMTCWKKIFVRSMGYLAIAGATIVKVPQIIKIIKKKSTLGVSHASIVFETLRQLSAAAHHLNMGNHFTVFGETLIMSVQSVVILLLFIIYNDQKGVPIKYIGGVVVVIIVFWAAVNPAYFPKQILEHALVFQMVLFASSRIFQIVEIHRLKSTGSLSAITCYMYVMGNVTRLGTALVEVAHDTLYRFSVLNAMALNSYILLCFLIFRKPPQQKVETTEKIEKNE